MGGKLHQALLDAEIIWAGFANSTADNYVDLWENRPTCPLCLACTRYNNSNCYIQCDNTFVLCPLNNNGCCHTSWHKIIYILDNLYHYNVTAQKDCQYFHKLFVEQANKVLDAIVLALNTEDKPVCP